MKRLLTLSLLCAAALPAAARYKPANFDTMAEIPSADASSGCCLFPAGTYEYRITQNVTYKSKIAGWSALWLPDGCTVTLWFKKSTTLTAEGNGGGTGIGMAPSAKLILRCVDDDGSAKVEAKGGSGIDAGRGENGQEAPGWTVDGRGGNGGFGASSGGAGIGGCGGGGGSGGQSTGREDGDGGPGGHGSNGLGAGTLFVYDGIDITATAGTSGSSAEGGAGGKESAGGYNGGGGGGGGGAAGKSAAIGGGGGGGGGGGAGGGGDKPRGGSGGGGGAGGGMGGSGGEDKPANGQKASATTGGAGGSQTRAYSGGWGGNVGLGGDGGWIAAADFTRVNNDSFPSASQASDGKPPTKGVKVQFAGLPKSSAADTFTLACNGKLCPTPVKVEKDGENVFLGFFQSADTNSTQFIDAEGRVVNDNIGDLAQLHACWLTPWDRLVEQIQAGGIVKVTRDYTQITPGATVTKDVTVDLNGHTLTLGGGINNFATVTDGTLTLTGTGRIVQSDQATQDGALVIVDGANAAFRMTGGAVTGLVTTCNGIICVKRGSASVSGGLIANCKAAQGGAVWVGAQGAFSLTDAAIVSNTTATVSGGAIFSRGATTLAGGILWSCGAGSLGKAVDVAGGKAWISGGVWRVLPESTGGTLEVFGGLFDSLTPGLDSLEVSSDYALEPVGDWRVVVIRDTLATSGYYLSAGDFAFDPLNSIYGPVCNSAWNYSVTKTGTSTLLYRLRRGYTEKGVGCESWEQIRTNFRAGYPRTFLSKGIGQGNAETLSIAGYAGSIDLNNYSLTGSKDKPLFAVTEGGSLTVTDDSADGNGALVGTGCSAHDGGGVIVRNGGSFCLAGGTARGFRTDAAHSGGFAYVEPGGAFSLRGGMITGCEAGKGGGLASDGTVTVLSGSVSNCTAGVEGGGLWISSSGRLDMSGGVVADCAVTDEVSGLGGGLALRGTGSFVSGTFKDNTAVIGGGIACHGGTLSSDLGTDIAPLEIRWRNSGTAPNGLVLRGGATGTMRAGYLHGSGKSVADGGVSIDDAGTRLTVYGGVFDGAITAGASSTLAVYGGVFGATQAALVDGYALSAVGANLERQVVGREGTVSVTAGKLASGTFTFNPIVDPTYAHVGIVDVATCNVRTLGGDPPHWTIVASASDALFVEGRLGTVGAFVSNATIQVGASVHPYGAPSDANAIKTSSQFATDENGYYSTMLVCDIVNLFAMTNDVCLDMTMTDLTHGGKTYTSTLRVGFVPYALHAKGAERLVDEQVMLESLAITNALMARLLVATGTVSAVGALVVTGAVETASSDAQALSVDVLTVGSKGSAFLSPADETTSSTTLCPGGETATALFEVETDGLLECIVTAPAASGSAALTVWIVRTSRHGITETVLAPTAETAGRHVLTVPVRSDDRVTVTLANGTSEDGALTGRIIPFGVKRY